MFNFEYCSQKLSTKKSELRLKKLNLTTLRNQNKFQIIHVKLFSHSFYTITGKYHEQLAILPMSVNLAALRIANDTEQEVFQKEQKEQLLVT